MQKCAAFTIVHNETVFLKKWLSIMTVELGPDNVYVLNHGTTGYAADELVYTCQECDFRNLIDVQHPYVYDSTWLTQITRNFQRFLLDSYQAVVFSAADEIVLPVAHSGGLRGYLTDFLNGDQPGVYAAGCEVVHRYWDPRPEPPLDFDDASWLIQRDWWYPCEAYTKPVIARVPAYWTPGWRKASNLPRTAANTDANLRLLHLHRIDYDQCLRRHRDCAAQTWKPEEKLQGAMFRHNLMEDPEMLKRWLACNADDTGQYAKLEEIPQIVKEAF